MTMGEIALSVGLLLNALAVIFSAILSYKKLHVVITDVEKIQVATDGMKNDLLEATKTAAFLQGVEAEKVKEK